MNFLSILGKIGGLAAAPFTGGASLIPTVLSGVGDVASVLGKQQQGKAQGQQAQESANLSRDRNLLDRYQLEQQAQNQAAQTDLQRKQFTTSDRGDTAKQALIGALLGGGLTPSSLSGGKVSGGLLQSLNGNPEALMALKKLAASAGSAQDAPPQFTGGQILQAPQLSAPTKIDNGGFLSTLANIGQLAGAASPYIAEGIAAKKKSPYVVDEEGLG